MSIDLLLWLHKNLPKNERLLEMALQRLRQKKKIAAKSRKKRKKKERAEIVQTSSGFRAGSAALSG